MTFPWDLERVHGPECPRCGCEDSRVVHAGKRWGRERQRRQCQACGGILYVSPPDTKRRPPANEDTGPPGTVTYTLVHCPECSSSDTYVTSTRRPIRHHKCRACSHGFKSVEK